MIFKGDQKLGDFFVSRRDKGIETFPVLSVTLNDGLVERTELDRKTESTLAPEEHLLVREGDIAYNMMRMWQGASGRADKDGIVSPAYIVCAPKNGVDSKYAAYAFKSPKLIHLFWAYSYGLTNDRLRLYYKDFEKIPVSFPPLPEQKKIARILSTWDKAIETVDKLIENSQQQKKALMQQLLTGKKRLPGFSGEWKKVRLGDVCTFRGGCGFKEEYQGTSCGDYPFIKVSDMNLQGNEKHITCSTNWISEETRKTIGAKAFPKNSVVFAKVGAALLLNRRRILTMDTLIDNNMMAAACSKRAHPEYMYQLLLTLDFAKYVQEGAVPSINQSTLAAIKILMPPPDEQIEIAKVLDGTEQFFACLEKQKENLSQQKKALMQQILTGKRRVQVSG